MTKHRTRAFNPTANKGLDIESIIGAPLVAASNANAMMLKEQTQFLMDFCFSKDGDTYHPVLIEMSLKKSELLPGKNPGDDPTIEVIETTFKLPLITIIPINSLAVNKVKVAFDMEITAQYEANYDSNNSVNRQIDGTGKTKLKGKISYDSKEEGQEKSKSQNKSKLEVDIDAGPLPLPIGLTTILDLYVKSVQPNPKASTPKK